MSMPGKSIEQRISDSLAGNPTGDTSETTQDQEATETPDGENEVEMYTVNPNGEEKEVTLEELKLGYMRGHDYQNKLSGTRKKKEKAEELEATLTETLSSAKSLIEHELDELNKDSDLKDIDPEEYWKRVDAVKTKAEKYKELQAKEKTRLTEKQSAKLTKELEMLTEAIPDWLDPEKKEKEQAEIVKHLSKIGYTNAEINGLSDHRIFVIARKAMQYDAITKANLKAKQTNKPPKVSKPGTTQKAEIKTTSARAKLQQTGSMRDAAAAIREMMK